MNIKFRKNKKILGFTLIELLVSVLIIGILATIGTIAYLNVQEKGRDSKRKADLSEIYKAITSYQAVHQGDLPLNETNLQMQYLIVCSITETKKWKYELEKNLSAYFANGLPLDPLSKCKYEKSPWAQNTSQDQRGYAYFSFNNKFSLWASLENESDPDNNSSGGTISQATKLQDWEQAKYGNLIGYGMKIIDESDLGALKQLYGLGLRCDPDSGTSDCD